MAQDDSGRLLAQLLADLQATIAPFPQQEQLVEARKFLATIEPKDLRMAVVGMWELSAKLGGANAVPQISIVNSNTASPTIAATGGQGHGGHATGGTAIGGTATSSTTTGVGKNSQSWTKTILDALQAMPALLKLVVLLVFFIGSYCGVEQVKSLSLLDRLTQSAKRADDIIKPSLESLPTTPPESVRSRQKRPPSPAKRKGLGTRSPESQK